MKKLEYHSALHPQSATDTEADWVIIGESIAMFNDITQYPLLPEGTPANVCIMGRIHISPDKQYYSG